MCDKASIKIELTSFAEQLVIMKMQRKQVVKMQCDDPHTDGSECGFVTGKRILDTRIKEVEKTLNEILESVPKLKTALEWGTEEHELNDK